MRLLAIEVHQEAGQVEIVPLSRPFFSLSLLGRIDHIFGFLKVVGYFACGVRGYRAWVFSWGESFFGCGCCRCFFCGCYGGFCEEDGAEG